jgi:hypothetical protein
LNSVGAESFEWIVNEVANLAVKKAKTAPHLLELRWAQFLGAAASEKQAAAKKPTAKKTAKKPAPKAATKS